MRDNAIHMTFAMKSSTQHISWRRFHRSICRMIPSRSSTGDWITGEDSALSSSATSASRGSLTATGPYCTEPLTRVLLADAVDDRGCRNTTVDTLLRLECPRSVPENCDLSSPTRMTIAVG